MNEFEQRILNLEREVRALKTAHRRGLAVVDFGHSLVQVLQATALGMKVKMTGSNSRTFPFLVQIAKPEVFTGRDLTDPIEINSEDNSITVHFFPFEAMPGAPQPDLKIVATDSIAIETDLEPIE